MIGTENGYKSQTNVVLLDLYQSLGTCFLGS